MPRRTRKKEGQVLVKEVEGGKWQAAWMDPISRRYVRRILPVTNYGDAIKEAKAIGETLATGRGFEGRMRGTTGHGIADALALAIKSSDANERVRGDYMRLANTFLSWLANHAPGVQSWGQVTEAIVEAYAQHSRREVAHATLKNRLFILRLTGGYMSRVFPLTYPRNPVATLKLKRTDAPTESADAILTMGEVVALVDWLKMNRPRPYVWGCLQGLCGMRGLEALYLREQDIGPLRQTVTVAESEAHRPKNRSSFRTIPIPLEVQTALRTWIAALKIRHPLGYLFVPSKAATGRRGAKFAASRAGAMGLETAVHEWAEALSAARLAGLSVPEGFTARKLRASFVTAMRGAGMDFETLQRFIGHTPGSVLSAHYDKMGLDRLKVIADVAQGLVETYRAESQNQPKLAVTLHHEFAS